MSDDANDTTHADNSVPTDPDAVGDIASTAQDGIAQDTGTSPEPAASPDEAADAAGDSQTGEAEEEASAVESSDQGSIAPAETEEPVQERRNVQAEAIARIATLEADVIRLEQEKQDNWNRYLRATADLENVRRRAKRDVEDARIDASTKVLKEMLPVIDSLERGLQHAESTGAASGSDGGVLEGVKLVLRQFAQALERCGVTYIDAVGKPFDPNLHEAISQIPTDEVPPGSVAQVLQKGYTINGRLLRPSMAVVAKAPPAPAPPAEETPAPEAADGEAGATEASGTES